MSTTWYLPYRGLPPEIIIEIIGKLINDYRALYYVGFCNKFMYDLSVRLLYRKMHSFLATQSVDYKTDARTKRIAIRAMRSLLNNLHLGVYVHEYTIEDPPPQLGQSAVPIEGLRRGLYAMVNLKHLTIETFNARERWKLLFDLDHPRYGLTLNSDHSIDWSASLNVPFHLETFTCRGYEAHTHCTISQADLNSFLKTQPGLRKIDIQLDEASWERRISQKTGGVDRKPLQIFPSASTCCPELEWVVGDRAAIESLLPGRKVRVVQWKHCRNDSGGSIHHLAKELALVEVLALPDSGIRGIDPPVVQMAPYMQDLKYLEVSNKTSVSHRNRDPKFRQSKQASTNGSSSSQ
ncbi:hypothetical protein JR316_0012299 [Psilocybe cubensis]|uniref:Uncharacterized protein n=2 Tax=Psilocybe cubensis TaxID=181762 RepID=A0A8H7XML1_PSICU|nr:hypothetical protein JR316_0012299 [Psilocybe cubensis]KAH9475188.1 hypothetical protein JR316_0012299 [Psilocybe cubensis]